MNVSTRVALVTGASRGLGLVIARVLAKRGYGVVIGGRDRKALDDAAAALSSDAPVVAPIAGAISDQSVRAVDRSCRAVGRSGRAREHCVGARSGWTAHRVRCAALRPALSCERGHADGPDATRAAALAHTARPDCKHHE